MAYITYTKCIQHVLHNHQKNINTKNFCKNNKKTSNHPAQHYYRTQSFRGDSEFKIAQLRSSTRAFSHRYSETSRETLVLPSNMFLFRDCDYIRYYLAMDSGTRLFDLLFCSDKGFLCAFKKRGFRLEARRRSTHGCCSFLTRE